MLQSSTRVVVEQAFWLLKGEFRCLKFLDILDLKMASKVLAIAMVLHKLCINNDDDTEADTTLNVASVHAFDQMS